MVDNIGTGSDKRDVKQNKITPTGAWEKPEKSARSAAIERSRKKRLGPFSPFVEIWQLWKSVEVDWLPALEINLAASHQLAPQLPVLLPQLVASGLVLDKECLWSPRSKQ